MKSWNWNWKIAAIIAVACATGSFLGAITAHIIYRLIWK